MGDANLAAAADQIRLALASQVSRPVVQSFLMKRLLPQRMSFMTCRHATALLSTVY